jgi:tripartite-type tricarboxylate transporter receptor subunit TctC
MVRSPLFAGLSVLTGLLVASTAVHAQSARSNKPVRLIIANSAGSTPDAATRAATDLLSRGLGQPWVVDNRPGGEGIIAAEAGAKAAPDGYTFFLASATSLAIIPHLKKSIPYDPVKDFIPVAMVIDSGPSAVAVNVELPIKTLPELIAYTRSNPGKLSYSVSFAYLGAVGTWLTNATRMDMVQINYKEAPQAVQDAIGGRVPVMLNALATVEQVVQTGKMRIIAMTSARRVPAWPDVATVAETVPGYEANAWLSLAAPAGTSMDVVNRVNKEMQTVVRNPQFLQRVEKLSWTNIGGANTPQGMSQFYRIEYDKWGKILRDAGVNPE